MFSLIKNREMLLRDVQISTNDVPQQLVFQIRYIKKQEKSKLLVAYYYVYFFTWAKISKDR